MLKLHRMANVRPEAGRPVLIYVKYYHLYDETLELQNPFFYVCFRAQEPTSYNIYKNGKVIAKDTQYKYIENGGEEYNYWYEKDIEGWCYTDEIDFEYIEEEKSCP